MKTTLPFRFSALLVSILLIPLYLASCSSGQRVQIPEGGYPSRPNGETNDGSIPDVEPIRTVEVSLSIVRGERVSDFCSRMEKAMLFSCEELESVAKNGVFPDAPSFLPAAGKPSRFEGMFIPGDYRFDIEETKNRQQFVTSIVAAILKRTGIRYRDLSRSRGLGPYQQMILASMVEKESVVGTNYSKIAGVFHERLRKNDRLGSCPTVEYVLGYHRPFLLFKDLEIKSGYNVYKRRGLPPTPIAFFSPEALEAVRNPDDSGNYFFVFNWVNGKHDFSRDGKTHMKKANQARQDFIHKFGRSSLYKIVPDVFYDYGAWITPPDWIGSSRQIDRDQSSDGETESEKSVNR